MDEPVPSPPDFEKPAHYLGRRSTIFRTVGPADVFRKSIISLRSQESLSSIFASVTSTPYGIKRSVSDLESVKINSEKGLATRISVYVSSTLCINTHVISSDFSMFERNEYDILSLAVIISNMLL